ncbi:hypothetical protein OIE68_43725 [Nocardia vinacea]|uniref:hypothetical protein n=1 Tax=Nocardia vinacea TaxID=96468 RepID=UPI002E165C64|nr:hypothetical protein OIE68_43725 [Nocardia vinacea]
MRSISALSTVVAAAVLMLGLAACDKEDNSAKATSTTAHATTTHPTTTYAAATPTTVTTPPPTTPAVAEPTTISCGAGPFGLAVSAVTTKGDTACPTALAVTNAYAVQSDLWDVGFVIPITVGTTTWDCQEHIGTPDLYQECVNRDNPTEKARLGS